MFSYHKPSLLYFPPFTHYFFIMVSYFATLSRIKTLRLEYFNKCIQYAFRPNILYATLYGLKSKNKMMTPRLSVSESLLRKSFLVLV